MVNQNFAAYERKDTELQENMRHSRTQIDKFKVLIILQLKGLEGHRRWMAINSIVQFILITLKTLSVLISSMGYVHDTIVLLCPCPFFTADPKLKKFSVFWPSTSLTSITNYCIFESYFPQ